MQTDKAHPTDIQQPFVPLVVLENALRYWWIVAVAIILGGAAGLLAHSFKPPLYESMAEFSIAVDLIGTGPLTQYEEDLGINTAGNVMVADDVKGSVARIAGILSDSGVNIATLRLTRKHRGGDAFMVIELDERPADAVGETLKTLPWVRWAHRIDKVGG